MYLDYLTHFVTPLEVGVFHEGSVTNFTLKKVMHVLFNNRLEHGVQICKIFSCQVIVIGQSLGLLTERTAGFTDVTILDDDGKMLSSTFTATLVLTTRQLDDLNV